MLAAAMGTLCVSQLPSLASEAPARSQSLSIGLASNVFDLRRAADAAAGRKPGISDPLEFLKESHRLGADGIQGPLGIRDAAYTSQLRRFAQEHDLYIEASLGLPHDASAVERFEQEVLTAIASGAQLARTVAFPGRRYEQFKTTEQFAQASQAAARSLELAEPVLRKHRFRLALENHKDQRVPERLELLKRLGSEWIGMCVDVGNSFALCEDPIEVVKAYAPLAWSVHLKDQAVRETDDGFLFADAPLGKGFLDLQTIVHTLHQANPRIHFNLEVMTRDPLRVPVLTAQYWATMPHVPAADLARMMRTVKEKSVREPLPRVTTLSVEQRAEVELRNITESLAYGREHLRP